MKVLIVTSSYDNAWPYLQELRSQLLKKKIIVHVLDIINFSLIKEDGTKNTKYKYLRYLNRIRGGYKLVGSYLAPYCVKSILTDNYDAINIHYLEPVYNSLVPLFRKHGKIISVSIWGSDFYRVSEKKIDSYKSIFNEIDYIGFNNSYTLKEFDNRVKGFSSKLKAVQFGIGKFETIKSIKESSSTEAIKKELGLPLDKIVVTCGYNANPAQQHGLIIEQLSHLDASYQAKIFLLFPMTYSGTKEYIHQIDDLAKKTGISYKIISGFLTQEDIVKIRIATDIVLNAQISDSFSASLQEHLLCGNVLIAGDWLPYQILDDIGVRYYPVSKSEFGNKLLEVLQQLNQVRGEVGENAAKIYANGNWEVRIDEWINQLYS